MLWHAGSCLGDDVHVQCVGCPCRPVPWGAPALGLRPDAAFKPGRSVKMQGVVQHVQRPKRFIERLGYMLLSVTVIVYVTHGVTCRAKMASTATLV